jgi:tripartite-type tricarboxylate transporter receptor subunit TctC
VDVISRLHAAMVKTVARPDLAKRLVDIGGTPTSSTPEQTQKHVAAEVAKWKRVVEQANIPQQ